MQPIGNKEFFCDCAYCRHGKERSSCKTAFKRVLKKQDRREGKEFIESEIYDHARETERSEFDGRW